MSHEKLLLVLAICLVPAIWQLIARGAIHWLWLIVALGAGVGTVVLW